MKVCDNSCIRDELLCDDDSVEEENIKVNENMSPVVKLSVLGKLKQVLVDTGCEKSCISLKFFEECRKEGIRMEFIPVKSTQIITAVGTKSQKVTRQVLVTLEVGKVVIRLPCLIIPNLVFEVMLGVDWLNQSKVRIDFEAKCVFVFVEGTGETERVGFLEAGDGCEGGEVERGDSEKINICHAVIQEDRESELHEVINKANVEVGQRDQLKEVLMELGGVFSESPGEADSYEHSFSVHDNSAFVGPIYAIPHKYASAVDKEIERMLELGIYWYNVAYHETIGYSPYEVQFGKKPVDCLAGLLKMPRDNVDYTLEFQAKARNRIKSASEKRLVSRQQITADEFEVGDKVLLRVHIPSSAIEQVNSKLFLLYRGMYTVVQRVGKSAYRLGDSDGKVLGVYNIRSLKRYRE